MAKKKIDKPTRELSKRQLTRWQQQEKRQRIVFIAGICVIIGVLLVVAVGWFMTQLRPLQQTVLEVNGTRFNMSYYIKVLTHLGKGQSTENLPYLVDYATNVIEQNELIYQGAGQMGVTVTDNEVKAELKKQNLGSDLFDMSRAQLLADKLKTNDYFTSKVPKSAPQAHILAMFLESETRANEVRARLEKGESFADLAGSLSVDSFTLQYKGDLGWHPEDIFPSLVGSSVPGDYAFASDAGVLSQPRQDNDKTKNVGYWLAKVLEINSTTNQVHVQAMLLSSAQEVESIKARLNLSAKDDFAAIAKEVSQLSQAKDNGGDLGWLSKGALPKVVEDVVFNKAVGFISDPIPDTSTTTTGGYWLIKVAEKAGDKELTKTDSDQLMGQQINAWLTLTRASANIQNFLNDSTKLFALDKAARALRE